jgi:hypothetical protein
MLICGTPIASSGKKDFNDIVTLVRSLGIHPLEDLKAEIDHGNIGVGFRA